MSGRSIRVIPAPVSMISSTKQPSESNASCTVFSVQLAQLQKVSDVADDLDEFEELPECEPAWIRLDRATACTAKVACVRLSAATGQRQGTAYSWVVGHPGDGRYIDAGQSNMPRRPIPESHPHTPAIDIDVLDPAVADELQGIAEQMIGTSAVRTGLAPKRALLFRTDTPFK